MVSAQSIGKSKRSNFIEIEPLNEQVDTPGPGNYNITGNMSKISNKKTIPKDKTGFGYHINKTPGSGTYEYDK